MKKYYKYIFLFIPLMGLVSCEDYLDKEVDVSITREAIFSDVKSASGFLNTTYNSVLDDSQRYGGGLLSSACDESVNSSSSSSIQFFNGGITPSYNPDNIWSSMYQGIRRSNIFLYELDHTIVQSNSIKEKNRDAYKGEALFLRALCHFELVKRYQMIPYVDEELTIATDFETNVATFQLSFGETIQRICNDCDSAISYLPLTVSAENLGRAHKASAMALKSRALLYDASLLNNNPASENYNIEKWKKAADAAKALIDLAESTPSIGLSSSFSSIFTSTSNSEILFASKSVKSNSFESSNFPISFGGRGFTNPSQNLVEAFGTKRGKTTEDDTNYDNSNPYDDRDARLYATVLHNGAFLGEKGKVNTYVGGKDGLMLNNNATKTGYYIAKFVNNTIDLDLGLTDYKHWIHFRLGEVYLNYAEALNEYLSAPNTAVYDALFDLRKRNFSISFLAKVPSGYDQKTMRDYIRNERRVELAFEGHRFWDLRRWKDLENLNATVRGMKIEKNENDTYTYTSIDVEERNFDERFFYYPIPRFETLKNDINQNEYWK